MMQLRKTFLCFPASSHGHDEAAVSSDVARRRWTHGRKRLRKRSPEEWLERLSLAVVQEENRGGASTGSRRNHPLVLSTEMLAFLSLQLPAEGNRQKEREVLTAYFSALSAVRLVERDARRSHPCTGLGPALFPALTTLDLNGVTPSALAPALPALRPTLQVLRLERTALCGLDELLRAASGAEEGQGGGGGGNEWTALQTLVLTHCDLGDLAPATALATSCPRLARVELAHNRLVSVRGLAETGAAALEVLDLRHNALSSAASFPACLFPRLHSLFLGHNAVRSTKGLEEAATLKRLDLSHNRLRRWAEVERLDDAGGGGRALDALWLEGNPLAAMSGYRLKVLALLRRGGGIGALDGQPPSAEEKEELARRLAPASLPTLMVVAQEKEQEQEQEEEGAAMPVEQEAERQQPPQEQAREEEEEEEELSRLVVPVSTPSPPPPSPLPEPVKQQQEEQEEKEETTRPSFQSLSSSSPSSLILEDGRSGESGEVSQPEPHEKQEEEEEEELPKPPKAKKEKRKEKKEKEGVRSQPSASLSVSSSSPSSSSSAAAPASKPNGRPRRVALVEEEEHGVGGGDEEMRASVEYALDRYLATPPPLPPSPPRPVVEKAKKKKRKKKAKEEEEEEDEVQDKVALMRQELAALEARLALAREEIGRVEERKAAALVGKKKKKRQQHKGREEEEEEEVEEDVEVVDSQEKEEEDAKEEEAELVAVLPQQHEEEELAVSLSIALPTPATKEDEEEAPEDVQQDDEADDDEETTTSTYQPRSSSSSFRRFLSLYDLDSIRSFLLEHHVFGSPTRLSLSSSSASSSLAQVFETDPARSLYHSLLLPAPEKLLHLYLEKALVDVRHRSGQYEDVSPR